MLIFEFASNLKTDQKITPTSPPTAFSHPPTLSLSPLSLLFHPHRLLSLTLHLFFHSARPNLAPDDREREAEADSPERYVPVPRPCVPTPPR